MAAPRSDQLDHLEGLTPDQRAAVEHTEGPLLVLAAAGSGKTRVITRRIAHLISIGVPPWRILALTFTNKAAGEMRERVFELLGGDAGDRRLRGLTVSTFHALCARLLRRYSERTDLPIRPEFTIYDTAEQSALMKRTIRALDLSTSNWPPRTVLAAISNAKNELQDAEAYAERASDFYRKQIAKIFKAYSAAMRQAGAIDFDDLLLLTAQALARHADIRAEVQDRWRYLMIDEYQDTNRAQLQIARLIAGEPAAAASDLPGVDDGELHETARDRAQPNICVVGDPDQSIYGWRGADITNILEFESHYPSARVIALGENFRSTEPVLAIADRLIKHNTQRKDKPLYTSRAGGEPATVVHCQDERHEAELVTDWFKRLSEDSDGRIGWRDMAVFYRTNALSRVMEDACRQAGIPYVIARGTAFYDREEIKSAVAYLKVTANPDDDVSLERIVNTPSRGIGKTSIQKLQLSAQTRGTSLFTQLRGASEHADLSARARAAIDRFTGMIDGWTGAGSFLGSEVPASLPALVERVIDESGLRAHYVKQAAASQTETDAERIDNLDELISSARQFEEEFDPAADPLAFPGDDALAAGEEAEVPPLLAMLRGFIESITLVADADAVDSGQGAVTLMTLHAAKGLEFPAVAMIGLEEGMLPHMRAMESESDLEEERRLTFVGITRAMRHLQISGAKYRTIRGMTQRTIPSRFLEEIRGEHVIESDQAGDFAYEDEDQDLGSSSAGSGNGQSIEAKLAGLKHRKAERSSQSAEAARRKFPIGSRVRHPQFGEGEVVDADGVGSSARLRIRFKGIGVKTLVLEYARLTRVG